MAGSSSDQLDSKPSFPSDKKTDAANMSTSQNDLTQLVAGEKDSALDIGVEPAQKKVQERYKNCDLVVPGIALKKLALCLGDRPVDKASTYLAVLGLSTLNYYKTTKQVLKGMVVGHYMGQSDTFWESASSHLAPSEVGALAIFSDFVGSVPQAPGRCFGIFLYVFSTSCKRSATHNTGQLSWKPVNLGQVSHRQINISCMYRRYVLAWAIAHLPRSYSCRFWKASLCLWPRQPTRSTCLFCLQPAFWGILSLRLKT